MSAIETRLRLNYDVFAPSLKNTMIGIDYTRELGMENSFIEIGQSQL